MILFPKINVRKDGRLLARYPAGHSLFMMAVQFAYGPSKEIVISGNPEQADMKDMIETIQKKFLPNTVFMVNSSEESSEAVYKILPIVEGKNSLDGKATAYVCENYACKEPVTDLEKLHQLLFRSI